MTEENLEALSLEMERDCRRYPQSLDKEEEKA